MKKTTRVGIGVLVGALALTIADDIYWRILCDHYCEGLESLGEDFKKATKEKLDWWHVASDYRWHRDLMGEKIDKRYEDTLDRWS